MAHQRRARRGKAAKSFSSLEEHFVIYSDKHLGAAERAIERLEKTGTSKQAYLRAATDNERLVISNSSAGTHGGESMPKYPKRLSPNDKRGIIQRRGNKSDKTGRKHPTGRLEIHHKDRKPANNEPSNLRVLTKKEHDDLHARGR